MTPDDPFSPKSPASIAPSTSGEDPLRPRIRVRPTRDADLDALSALSRAVYRHQEPWTRAELAAQRRAFPRGQLVAVETRTQRIVGMAASLRIRWADYKASDPYDRLTAKGTFRNHNPRGETLYGGEVMVHPRSRGLGVGRRLYAARRALARALGATSIRAGGRLPRYSLYAGQMSVFDYVGRVVRGEMRDPTLSFQLREGFEVLGVVRNYDTDDVQSLGYAALIEWRNTSASVQEAKVQHPE